MCRCATSPNTVIYSMRDVCTLIDIGRMQLVREKAVRQHFMCEVISCNEHSQDVCVRCETFLAKNCS
jgi:hypothetical protein